MIIQPRREHRADLVGIEVDFLQELFGEPSADQMMRLSYPASREELEALRPYLATAVDPDRFDYFVSGWAESGFQTRGGLYPPPKDPPTSIEGAIRIRPR